MGSPAIGPLRRRRVGHRAEHRRRAIRTSRWVDGAIATGRAGNVVGRLGVCHAQAGRIRTGAGERRIADAEWVERDVPRVFGRELVEERRARGYLLRNSVQGPDALVDDRLARLIAGRRRLDDELAVAALPAPATDAVAEPVDDCRRSRRCAAVTGTVSRRLPPAAIVAAGKNHAAPPGHSCQSAAAVLLPRGTGGWH